MEDLIIYPEFEEAFIGISHSTIEAPKAVYDYYECVRILIEDYDMTEEDAKEHLDFNFLGSYLGEHTPIFIVRGNINE